VLWRKIRPKPGRENRLFRHHRIHLAGRRIEDIGAEAGEGSVAVGGIIRVVESVSKSTATPPSRRLTVGSLSTCAATAERIACPVIVLRVE